MAPSPTACLRHLPAGNTRRTARPRASGSHTARHWELAGVGRGNSLRWWSSTPTSTGPYRRHGERCPQSRPQSGRAVGGVGGPYWRWGCSTPPGSYDADIVTGEGQPLGHSQPSYGGPYLGLFTAKQQYIRQMPSRWSGRDGGQPGAAPGTC